MRVILGIFILEYIFIKRYLSGEGINRMRVLLGEIIYSLDLRVLLV